MSSQDLQITLSIVSHAQGHLVRHLLDDLSHLQVSELIVTLNIPEDEGFLRAFKGRAVTVIRNSVPRGFGANHNAAFGLCRTPWFAILNPDLRLPYDPFVSMVATASTFRKPGVVAPRIIDPSGRLEDAVRQRPTPWSVAGRIFSRRIGRADVADDSHFWLAGMFLLFSSDAYRQVGGFDERFFLYYEDYDICTRLRRAGFAIAVDRQVHAVHEAQRDSRRSLRHLRWHLASLLRVWTSAAFWRVLTPKEEPGATIK